jgi:hypothetical protein
MARDHARFKTARTNDDDWRALTVDAQWLYDTLLTQPRLSYCGVLDYMPGRLATQAKGMTETKVRAAARALERARFVVLDQATSEILVRSYVRHDGVFDRRNMGKAVATALAAVVSAKIRDAVLMEIARLIESHQGDAGLGGFAELDPEGHAMACAMASTIPLPIASGG